MKTKQIAVVFLLFFRILGGCTPKISDLPNEKTYTILAPPSAPALKDVAIVMQKEQLIFIKNNQEKYEARVLPRPPAPCEDIARCLPDTFIFTLIDENKAVINVSQSQLVLDVDISNLPNDLKKEMMTLESQSFSAQLGTPLQIKK